MFNKIINWVVFDCILFIFYNSIQHNGHVSPERTYCVRKFGNTCVVKTNLNLQKSQSAHYVHICERMLINTYRISFYLFKQQEPLLNF